MLTNNDHIGILKNNRQHRAKEILSKIDSTRLRVGQQDLLIYLHIPFCNSKCIFCDWVTPIAISQLRSTAPIRTRYVQSLCAQIREIGPILTGRGYVPRIVYWGGGTPSKLEASDFSDIIGALRDSFDLSAVTEHSIEASPESLTVEKLRTLREHGVSRISIGAQSMDDGELKNIGRAHSSAQVIEGTRMAREAEIPSMNIDLIVGFPGQSVDMVVRSVRAVIAQAPDHVTVYPYRPSPGTVMSEQIISGRRVRGSLKEVLDCYNAAILLLQQAGYQEYCLGYFAKAPEHKCLAEEYYFSLQGDYIGFGSGARSILGGHMLQNAPEDLHGYIADPTAFDTCERYTATHLENILPALRLALFDEGGINFRRFEAMFGFPVEELMRDPMVTGLLDYLRLCGTEFVKDEHALYATPESRARGYIMSLMRAFVPMKKNEEKLNDAFSYVAEHVPT